MNKTLKFLLLGLPILFAASCSSDEEIVSSAAPDFSGITAYNISDVQVVDSAKFTYRDLINARIQMLEAQDNGSNDAEVESEIASLRTSLVSVDSIEHAIHDSISAAYGVNGANLGYINVAMKKIKYKTKSANGDDVELSALVAYSGADYNFWPFYTFLYYKPNCMLIGCHATITSNAQAPTNLLDLGTIDFLKTDVGQIVLDGRTNIYSGLEALTVIPDYEGWGDSSNRNHPYLMQEATARQVVDAATQVHSWFTKNCKSMEDDWRTAIIGYSQGASTAMATMKHIEQTSGLSDQLHLGGAVCADGPYDPLATMNFYVKQGKVNLPEALVLIVLGACDYDVDMKHYSASDFFTDKFINTGIVDALRAKNKTSDQLQDQIKEKGVTCFEGNYWRLSDLMRPEIINYFSGKEIDEQYKAKCEALYNSLKRNNLAASGWKPAHHLVLFHAANDPTVPIDNYWSVARTMNNDNFMGIRANYDDVRTADHTDVATQFYLYWDKGLLRGIVDEDHYNDSEYFRKGLWYTEKYTLNCERYSADTLPKE